MSTRVNRRGVARREVIIDAAIELWSTTGWRGTSIAAVAERAGVTDQGVLHHFGTKQNLLLAVVAEQDRRTVTHLADMFETGGLDTLRRIPDLARRSIESQPEVDKLFVVLQAENLDSNGPAHDYFVARQRFTQELWTDVVRTGQARGEIRSDVDPELIALQIEAFLGGAHSLRHVSPEPIDLVALYQDFTDRLVRDLTAGTDLDTTPPSTRRDTPTRPGDDPR